jgi:hypothetical protein
MMAKQTEGNAANDMMTEWFRWLAENIPLETERPLRQYKMFAVTHGNMWYEVWNYANEASHYVTLHGHCGGQPAHYTTAGRTIAEASKWAVDLATKLAATDDE